MPLNFCVFILNFANKQKSDNLIKQIEAKANAKIKEEAAKADEKAKNVYGNGHTSLYLDFIDSIENNRKPYVDLYVGKRVIEIVLAIYKSQKTGLPVKFPLKEFATVDMTGEFDK